MDIHRSLEGEDYEVSYRRALIKLGEKYDRVGEPYLRDGQRVCRVETLVVDDRTVFVLAWGISVANDIEQLKRQRIAADAS